MLGYFYFPRSKVRKVLIIWREVEKEVSCACATPDLFTIFKRLVSNMSQTNVPEPDTYDSE